VFWRCGIPVPAARVNEDLGLVTAAEDLGRLIERSGANAVRTSRWMVADERALLKFLTSHHRQNPRIATNPL
jgi:hypothetical protein